jgi:excisionase family DNA binding protein
MKLWLNVAEGAEYAGVCRDLIYDACSARRLHHIRVGGRRAIRLQREWIDAWLERHAVVAQDGPLPMRTEAGAGARTEGRP